MRTTLTGTAWLILGKPLAELLYAGDATIHDLHLTIQAATGWKDYHLHQCTIRGQRYGERVAGGVWWCTGPDHLRLSEFRLRHHERFVYEYDFYSAWKHDIRLEAIVPQASAPTPTCIAGKGACPPKDNTRNITFSVG